MKNLIIAKIRVKISNILNRFLLGKVAGNIPYSIIRDIKEIVELKSYKDNIFLVKKLDNCYVEKYNFPDHYPIRFPREKAYESKYIYKIKNAYVSARTGVIWTYNGKILLESIGSMGRLLGWGGVLVDLLMNKSIDIIEDSVIVCPDTGYYHWLLEVLPNILHLLKNIDENVKIVISSKSSRYLTTALKHILTDNYNSKIIILDKPIKVKKIYFAYYENQSGFIRKIDRNILKEYFLLDLAVDTNRDRKIYISRLKSPKRSIGNEKEVEKLLKSNGFEIVYAEDLDFLEQIKLFDSSKFIVAPHGAGLSNIIWCSKDTKILEIFPYDNLHFCFATLAKSNDLIYDFMVCNEDKNSSGVVDLKTLEQKVCNSE